VKRFKQEITEITETDFEQEVMEVTEVIVLKKLRFLCFLLFNGTSSTE
jgi:hypothetical protein